MMLIIVFLVPISIKVSGGLAAMNERLQEIGPEMTKVFGNGYTPLLALFIVVFYSLLQMGQPNISSRFFALKNVKDFKKVFFTTLIGTLMMSSVFWAGLAARIRHPEIVADYSVPTIIMNYFPSVIAVIAVIAIMCAMMTTIDGLLHSISTSIGIDLVRDTFGEKDEKKVLFTTRIATVVVGLIAMVFALFWYPQFISMLVFGALAGVGSCTVGPILVGVFDKKANKVGATVAAVVSELLFCGLLVFFGSKVSIFYIGTPCLVLNIVLTIVVSRLAGKPDAEIVAKLFPENIGSGDQA
jgi:Na+/proline symporter